MDSQIQTGFIAIAGVLVGSILSYYSQKWTQDRAWKREYGLKTIDTIYAPLYNEIRDIKESVEAWVQWRPKHDDGNDWIPMGEWDKIESSHLHHMILDENFKTRIEEVYNKNRNFSNIYIEATKAIREILITLIDPGEWSVDESIFQEVYGATFLDKTLLEYSLERYGDGDCIKNQLLEALERYKITLPEDFFDSVLAEANKLQTLTKCRDARKELISECDSLLKELAGKISEPWKV